MSDKILYPHDNSTDTIYGLVFDADQVWDVGGAAFVPLVDANWDDYDTVFTQLGTASQIFSGTFPATIPAGVYDILIFAGSPAAVGDERQAVMSNLLWDGANWQAPGVIVQSTARRGT